MSALEFRLLGPLEVDAAGTPVPLGGPKQRALLAYLLLHPGQVISDERLIDELWGEEPPATARNTIQVYVSQLRKLVDGAIRRSGAGYAIEVEPEVVDAHRFARLVAAGQAALAVDDPILARRLLEEALGLWRGAALGGLSGESFVSVEGGRLEEERLAALEARIDADLALGGHGDVVGELEALVAEHPLRERFRVQQMLALYRAQRQAEALEAYRRARETMVEELGIEPGRELQELERAILRQDPELEAPVGPAAVEAREVRKTVTVVAVARPGGVGDPEASRRLVERELAVAGQAAARHGGTVEGSNEAALVVFGLPELHEDDPVRAVRAAAELREALGEVAAIGIATGEVLAQDAVLVAGDAAAAAARLAAHAQPGEVLLDDATHALVADAVDCERLRRPSGAWRLLGVVPGAPGYARREDLDLLGRAGELAELRHAFERTRTARSAHLFTLLGPAGIGKSRLVREFSAEVAADARVLVGRCLAYGEGITFWPLAEVVRQAVPDATLEGIRAALGDDPDAESIAGRIAGAIGLAEVRAGADAIFWAARRLFERLAAERPLVLVFDDVQWAEQTFLDLIEHLVEWTKTAPVLVVCLARPEFLEERVRWGGLADATTLMLGPLSDAESEEFLDRLFAERPPSPETRDRIVAAAEGNPLFIEQMGALLDDDDAPAHDEPVVPPTIHALLAARLERLPREERDAIERAAVIGREFWAGAVAALDPAAEPEADGSALRSLVRKLLVRPADSRFRGEDAYRFQHQLIREVAYDAIPKALRAELHERFADWFERTAPAAEPETQELLGYHLEQAFRYRSELGLGGWETIGVRARELLFAAGRRAVTRGDVHAAVGLLGRAAEITPLEDEPRADVLTEFAEALRESGDFARSDFVLAEALALAAAGDHRAVEAQATLARLRVRMATTHDLASAEIERVVEESITALDELGDERRLAKAWFLRAWLEWLGCRAMDSAESSRRSAEHARRAGDERGQAQALHLLVGADLFGPTPVAQAIERCAEVMRALPAQRRVTASALRATAGLAAMEGRFEDALAMLAEDRAILEDLGLRVAAAGASEIAGTVHLLAGDAEAAERELRHGYEAFERMGEQAALSTLAAMLAQALYAQGRDDEALAFTAIGEESAAPDDLHTQVQWRGARAKLLARAGGAGEAERLAREGVALADRTDFLVMRGNAVLDLGEVLLALGRGDEAAAAGDEALALYDRKGATALALRVSSGRPSRS